MSKITVTTLVFMVLLLSCMLSHSARPEPAFRKEDLIATQHQHAESIDESCDGIGEEECLIKRTLTAHIDYIYTQKHNP
ncbi:hypothetical protein VNO77_40991 [Canavalia gladiata]|uniref:Phytosulfokine n=1 Tax=Canavalia gladiata TaxID=3824 RepID=A0AAN9PS96_CANGL